MWLQNDFEQRESPKQHFLNNSSIIADSFREHNGMLALEDNDELVAYMVWSYSGNKKTPVMTIDIVEVLEKHQNKGIFKRMMSALYAKFPHILVFTWQSIADSVEKFRHLGFQERVDNHGISHFHKQMRDSVIGTDILLEGLAIGITSVDYYEVCKKPDSYPKKYFGIKVDGNQNLELPIIAPYHKEGYVGVYFNKTLITAGKARHLFKKGYWGGGNLLVLYKIRPCRPELFAGFLEVTEEKKEVEENISETDAAKMVSQPSSAVEFEVLEPPYKKRRTGLSSKRTLFFSSSETDNPEKHEDVQANKGLEL